MASSDYDVVVVGGGPAGAWTAAGIARKGLRVLVIEEHETIGEPVQCAGLVTSRVFDMVDFAGDVIMNRVKGAVVHSPSGATLDIGGDRVRALVMDRAAFDRRLMEHAVDSGAELSAGQRVTGIVRGNPSRIRFGNTEVTARLVIGADGARSSVRKWLGLQEPAYFLNGFGADITGLDPDQDRLMVFFGNGLAPKFFAWMIPAGDLTRVGLCIRDGDEPVYGYFKKLFTGGPAAEYLRGGTVASTYSGLIPIGLPARTYADGGMIVGDAAAHVKATSGGGLYPGLACAAHCAAAAGDALEADDVSEKRLAGYQKAWLRDIGDELRKDVLIHKVFASMTNPQIEEVFSLLSDPDTLEIINRVGDIDYPSRLGWMLLKREPKLLKYAGKFLRYGIRGR